MYVPKRKVSITVALPASTTTDIPHLREKTFRLGFIGRTLAIFRVDKLLIYRDKPQKQDFKLMEKILSYMTTPQYLRKKVFGITPELKYVGTLPPLRTPNHPLKKISKELRKGDIRKGLVIKSSEKFSLVDIGVEKPVKVEGYFKPKTLINVEICEVGKEFKAKPVGLEEISSYWGFKVEAVNQTLDEVAERKEFDLKIATSRYGQQLQEVMDVLIKKWNNSKKVLIAFGSPTEGIKEILKHQQSLP